MGGKKPIKSLIRKKKKARSMRAFLNMCNIGQEQQVGGGVGRSVYEM